MDLVTFCRTLCQQLGREQVSIPTGIFSIHELVILYSLKEDEHDILIGEEPQNKPDLARRLFLRLFSGIPSIAPATITDTLADSGK